MVSKSLTTDLMDVLENLRTQKKKDITLILTQSYTNPKCEMNLCTYFLKFMFSKKATKIDEIFTVDLTVRSKCQIDGEEFVNFCGLLRRQEL